MVNFEFYAKSDIGKRRQKNEDAFYADNNGLFMVADGMGGHRAGDKASKIAIKEASYFFINSLENKEKALKSAFLKAAEEVYHAQISDPELTGMGTTLSALVIDNNKAYIYHIGDSRIYLLRDKNLELLTKDHSLVNEQIQAGLLSEKEARTSSLRNIITKAIGHKQIITPDQIAIDIQNKDIFLLCTDGLNNMLLDQEILAIIANNSQITAIDLLIREANKLGGDDNITVILIKINN